MTAEYNTIEDALKAVDLAVEETLADNPEMKQYGDDVYHHMVQAIASECSPEVERELSQRTGVPLDYE